MKATACSWNCARGERSTLSSFCLHHWSFSLLFSSLLFSSLLFSSLLFSSSSVVLCPSRIYSYSRLCPLIFLPSCSCYGSLSAGIFISGALIVLALAQIVVFVVVRWTFVSSRPQQRTLRHTFQNIVHRFVDTSYLASLHARPCLSGDRRR